VHDDEPIEILEMIFPAKKKGVATHLQRFKLPDICVCRLSPEEAKTVGAGKIIS